MTEDEEKKERRSMDRVKIDGAMIIYRHGKDPAFFNRYSHPMPLEDMTWSSFRFQADKFIRNGEVIDIELKIPGEHKIKVKGQLIWTAAAPDDETQYAVVQLLPFGSGKQYNSMSVREKLKALIEKYKQHVN